MAKGVAPQRTTEEWVRAWLAWAAKMEEWGKLVRADIVRLEKACAKCSNVDFSKKAKLVGKQATWQADPGDPPTPPT